MLWISKLKFKNHVWIKKSSWSILNSFDTITWSVIWINVYKSEIYILLNEAMNQKSMNILILMFLNDIFFLFPWVRLCCCKTFFFLFYERAGAIIIAFSYSPDLLGNDLVCKHGNTVRTSAEKKEITCIIHTYLHSPFLFLHTHIYIYSNNHFIIEMCL